MEFTKADEDYIINIIDADNVKRNLSILGGEPLCEQNIGGVIELCKRFKKKYPNKKIYIWTGYRIEDLDETQSEILEYIDFLIDGKFEIDKKDISLFMKGSHNQRILVSGKDFNLEPF
jgi:anaerobic ribonucleoside-triphosphate reductase activating protein